MIDVLIVDDSAVSRHYLEYILVSEKSIRVVGTVTCGEDALRFLRRSRPDVVLMDMAMPGMDGFETTRQIMQETPTPVVIVSAFWQPADVEKTLQATRVGAVAILEKPKGLGHPDAEHSAQKLIGTVKLMAGVPVVRRRWNRPSSEEGKPETAVVHKHSEVAGESAIVAIGASTGGPNALSTLLSNLPSEFPVPILIVQHITAGFVEGMIEWLQQITPLPIHLATRGEKALPGHIYMAPDDYHLGITKSGYLVLSDEAPIHGVRPAVAYLFRAVTASYGNRAIGVLLTGMGKDGAAELHAMKECGAITIAQDQASSVIHGMPGEAIRLGAATHIKPLDAIAGLLTKLTTRSKIENNGSQDSD